jgi:hypothetical protein
MFSQFRQAVENLAQPIPRPSQDDPFPADVRTRSPDSQRPSSPQLAENTLVNLRTSIAAQRAASPVQQNTGNPRPRSASPGPSSTARSTSDAGLRKTTLEERLRASFAVSESSGSSAPNPSTSVSSTVPVTQHPLSPASTPVPDSPTFAADTITSALETPVGGSVQDEQTDGALAPPQEPNDAAQLPSATPPPDPHDPTNSTEGSTDTIPIDSTTDPCVGVTLTQEAPQATHTEPEQKYTQASEVVDALTADTDPPREEDVKGEPEPTIIDRSKDVDVEALQERLKLVEQRFAGNVAYIAHLS